MVVSCRDAWRSSERDFAVAKTEARKKEVSSHRGILFQDLPTAMKHRAAEKCLRRLYLDFTGVLGNDNDNDIDTLDEGQPTSAASEGVNTPPQKESGATV